MRTVLSTSDAAKMGVRRELSDDALADALDYWAESREWHAHADDMPKLLDGVTLLREAARRLRQDDPRWVG